MKKQLGWISDALAANLWLVPSIAFVLAFALSRALWAFDQNFDTSNRAWFIYGGSPQGARQLLATVAGSMITFIGMVFSSTILVLQLASSQFSPRIMRSFFRDRVIQVALGTFIATFAFAILVLREVREENGRQFVPGLSTFIAISFVWLSLAMFVIYINHIGNRIRAATVIRLAAKETRATLARMLRARPPAVPFALPQSRPDLIVASGYGIVASIDVRELVRIAQAADAVIAVVPSPGDFIPTGGILARVWFAGAGSPTLCEHSAAAIGLEAERTMREDALFGIRQLVDIADKALSPGINDPTTAAEVLDQLHEILAYIASGSPGPDVYCDPAGEPRLSLPGTTWREYLEASLEEILLYGRGSLHVMRRLRTLVVDLEASVASELRIPLRSWRNRIENVIDAHFDSEADRTAARRLPPATRTLD